jgi:tRNA1(Val) A37 N6-methylase TrmN6
MIHRPDRMPEILEVMTERTGGIVLFPIWPSDPNRAGEPATAKRVIVQARIGSGAPLRLTGGLSLHEADGRYTEAAENVLRHGGALALGA